MVKRLDYHRQHLVYRITGEGPALVLAHGFLCSKTMWNSIVPTLAKEYTCIVPDFPGHGETPSFGPVHTMRFMAKGLTNILKQENIDTCHYVGHSMGGYVGLALADAEPHCIERLILFHSTPLPDSQQKKEERLRAIGIIQMKPGTYVQQTLNGLFASHTDEAVREGKMALIREAMKMESNGISAALAGMRERPDRSDVLKQFGNRACMIVGTRDPVLSHQQIKAIGNSLSIPVLSIRNAGHMGHIETPNEALQAIQNALNGKVSSG